MPRSAAFHSIATRCSPGTISLRSSSRLGVTSADTSEMPVRLLPGRARLSTNPVPTGSPAANDTTGRVVPRLAASARGIAESNDKIDLASDQFVDEARQPFHVRFCTTALERQILIQCIALLGKAADERRPEGTIVGNRRPGAEQPDAIHFGPALCGDSARPYYGRAEKSDELPPPHRSPPWQQWIRDALEHTTLPARFNAWRDEPGSSTRQCVLCLPSPMRRSTRPSTILSEAGAHRGHVAALAAEEK